MSYLNKCQFIGVIRDHPQVRILETSGKTRGHFFLDVCYPYQSKEGESKVSVQRIVCVAFNDQGELVRQLRRGEQIYVEGKLQTRSYKKNNNKYYLTEIIVSTISKLGMQNN